MAWIIISAHVAGKPCGRILILSVINRKEVYNVFYEDEPRVQ